MNVCRNVLMMVLVLTAGAHVLAATPKPVQPPAATPPPVTTNAAPVPAPPASSKIPKLKAVDADDHMVLINRPGKITLVLGTSEDSQDAARAAGDVVHPFQGRPDFQLVVVVDLRDSLATWVPSIVIQRMRASLDREAVELKPFYLQNGNKNNPRGGSHVIADFNGTICPQLGWDKTSDDLRAIIYGTDGRELKRWEKLEDMNGMQADVRSALENNMDAERARNTAAKSNQGTKVLQPPAPLPPLPPTPPPSRSK